jgi:polygalacturonase
MVLRSIRLQSRARSTPPAAPGGGVVWFGPGRDITGTLLLKTGVTLDLAQDAALLGSTDPGDYRLLEPFVDAVGTTRSLDASTHIT